MKKEVFGIIFVVGLFFILSLSIVSAFSFGDWIKGIFGGNKGVTGNVVDNTPIYNSVYCADSDNGIYSTKKGTISVSGKQYTDLCYNLNKTVFEYYCSGSTYKTEYINCLSDYYCSNGECKPPLPIGSPIGSCQIINIPGDYYLEKNINFWISDQNKFEGNIACIVINSSNVNLNLNDKKLFSKDSKGIAIMSYGANNTKVFKGSIISNSNAIYLFYGSFHTITGISFYEQEPVSQFASNQIVILNNTFSTMLSGNTFKKITRNGVSINLFKADRNDVINNTFNHKFNNGYGLNIISLMGLNNISNNKFNNASINIEPFYESNKYFESKGNFFVSNTLYNSSIYLLRNERDTISFNNFLDNGVINLILSSRTLISNNIIIGKLNMPILKTSSLNSIFSGIYIQSSNESRIFDNSIYNSDKGIMISGKDSSFITIKNNFIKNNSIGLYISNGNFPFRDLLILGGNIRNLTIIDNIVLSSIKTNYDLYCSSSEDNFGEDNVFDKKWKCAWADNKKRNCP
ncbi:hypothetical protein HYW75_01830 [Candidatus Pacearchaeota archaeon]|nr:hypothetical protein [Candidatus Pacearchaeota archaeon]